MRYASFLILLLLVTGCAKEIVKEKIVYMPSGVGERILYELPPKFADTEEQKEVFEFYKEFMFGRVFFIDPGHGGKDRWGKSSSGKVVEADVNLRVALFLKEYLENSGTRVIMSRVDDSTVELGERSEMANKSGADFFISIHHNSPGDPNNFSTNFTSTFYHAREGNYEHEPCNRDLARYVQRDLAYAMDNPGGLGSFDGTYSDYNIYPGDGFSVLRKTELPAILVEAGFFSNRLEEERLQDIQFNRIEAWGIYKGIGKYLRDGFPEIEFDEELSGMKNKSLTLVYNLVDKKGIVPESIVTYVDSTIYIHDFDEEKNQVTIKLEKPAKGEHEIRIICRNTNGNHSLPYHKKILVR